MQKLLTNKLVLNLVFLIFVLNILGTILIGRFERLVYFALVGTLISYFSKNLTIILGATLVLTNFLISGQAFSLRLQEGMDTDTMTDDEKKTFVNEQLKQTKAKINAGNAVKTVTTRGADKPRQTPPTGTLEKKGKKPAIDYASTVETAYKDLNGVLGSDGMKNLTSDTKNLVAQQQQLAEAMQGMAPLIQNFGPLMNQATEMMKTMGKTGGLANLTKMIQ